jgi:hypothetical protein
MLALQVAPDLHAKPAGDFAIQPGDIQAQCLASRILPSNTSGSLQ